MHGMSIVFLCGKNVLHFNMRVQRGFLSDRKGKVIQCRWAGQEPTGKVWHEESGG